MTMAHAPDPVLSLHQITVHRDALYPPPPDRVTMTLRFTCPPPWQWPAVGRGIAVDIGGQVVGHMRPQKVDGDDTCTGYTGSVHGLDPAVVTGLMPDVPADLLSSVSEWAVPLDVAGTSLPWAGFDAMGDTVIGITLRPRSAVPATDDAPPVAGVVERTSVGVRLAWQREDGRYRLAIHIPVGGTAVVAPPAGVTIPTRIAGRDDALTAVTSALLGDETLVVILDDLTSEALRAILPVSAESLIAAGAAGGHIWTRPADTPTIMVSYAGDGRPVWLRIIPAAPADSVEPEPEAVEAHRVAVTPRSGATADGYNVRAYVTIPAGLPYPSLGDRLDVTFPGADRRLPNRGHVVETALVADDAVTAAIDIYVPGDGPALLVAEIGECARLPREAVRYVLTVTYRTGHCLIDWRQGYPPSRVAAAADRLLAVNAPARATPATPIWRVVSILDALHGEEVTS